MLAVLVAVWHLPLVVAGQGNAVGAVGLISTFFITFVYWLFRRSGGSVLLTMLFHVVQGTITIETFGYGDADVRRMLWLGCAAWTLIAIAVVVLDRPAWRPAPREPRAGRPAGDVLTTP